MKTTIPPVVCASTPLMLVGCGILHKEVNFLIHKNNWNIEPHFLESALHNYLGKLAAQLNDTLDMYNQAGVETVVFYGACHPLMDKFLNNHHTVRTPGQNCIVMLLGYERFMEELEKGAYFLLEDWALTWKPLITGFMGNNVTVIREIFHTSHKHILAIRTPCSDDFTAAAEAAAQFVDLPLIWMDASLDHLESVLKQAIEQKQH